MHDSDTGNGAILTLSNGFTARITRIDFDEETLESLDDSDLLTEDVMQKAMADLVDAGGVSFDYLFRSDQDRPAFKVALTATITFPLFPGKTTPASISGTGFLRSRKMPELVNNQLQAASGGIEWDGKTGPTYTKAT